MGEKDETDSTFARSQTEPETPPLRSADGDADPIPAETVLAERYEVRGPIGRGGMGLVVEAFDRTLGVRVAIKIVRAEYAGDRRWSERLAREVKLARQIQHPNVCRVFDFAQAEGRAFLSMDLASAGTLRSQLSAPTSGARPIAARLADARAIAAGVAAIHAAGIVHRDLSPQNVLRMDDGRLVVADFGLATDSSEGTTSIHGGTVAYMAPEVLRGGRATVAADIWALGAVIHEVVLGERLRWDPRSAQVPSAAARRPLTRAERSVFEICRACTALNPAQRPRDAGTIAARLSEAGLARATHRRWWRRAVAAAAAGLLVVGVVAGGRRAQSRRRRAAQTAAGPADSLMIVPIGEPDDWTDKAKVLAEVPDTIRCMVALPYYTTIRFVWGYPAHAEDLDTRTGSVGHRRWLPRRTPKGARTSRRTATGWSTPATRPMTARSPSFRLMPTATMRFPRCRLESRAPIRIRSGCPTGKPSSTTSTTGTWRRSRWRPSEAWCCRRPPLR